LSFLPEFNLGFLLPTNGSLSIDICFGVFILIVFGLNLILLLKVGWDLILPNSF